MSKYEIELWDRGTRIVGNINEFTKGRRWKKAINGVYEIDFDVNARRFDRFCAMINENPNLIIKPHVTDVRIKRNGKYEIGGFVIDAPLTSSESGDWINVQADGFLNLLERYVTKTYRQVRAEDIAWDMISTSQAQDGDINIRRGVNFANSALRDKTYVDTKVSDSIVNFTNYASKTFEFEFSPERKFNTYDTMGSPRPDVAIVYPATATSTVDQSAGTIAIGAKSFKAPRNGTNMFNKVIGKGSGFGDSTLTTTYQDAISKAEFYTRTKIATWNSVSDMTTLQQHTQGEVMLDKNLYDLPEMTISGADFDRSGIQLGDRVYCVQSKHNYAAMAAYYRIVAIECSIDQNDNETFTLTFDNFKVKPDGTMEE